MNEVKLKFGIKAEKFLDECWGFGIHIIHILDETYLNIDLFKLTIKIGKIYM